MIQYAPGMAWDLVMTWIFTEIIFIAYFEMFIFTHHRVKPVLLRVATSITLLGWTYKLP